MPAAPSQEAQIAEGQNRELVRSQQEARGDRTTATAEELRAAGEVFEDPARSEPAPPAPLQDPPARAEEPHAPVDVRAAKRADIISRFRTDRNQETDDDFSRSGTPEGFEHPVPELAPEPPQLVEEDQPQLEQQQQEQQSGQEPPADPPPRMRKVKVRGREYEVSEEEYHAAAQKALAGDNYLDEAKQRLVQVDELLRDVQTRARHPGQHGEHHAGQDEVQPGQREPNRTEDPQQPEDDPLTKAIELIQYGDPTEARQFLDSALEQKAAKIANAVVQNTLQTQKFEDEAASTAKVLKAFEDQHPDLAKDNRARAAIQATVLQFQREDLEAIGVDLAKIQTKSGHVTADDIATVHRLYRMRGYGVRPPAQLLEDARDDFLAWRGQAPTRTDDPPADPNPDARAQPRIAVQVDRTQRRQSIPLQPSRSAAPQRSMTQPAPQPRDRSAIVEGIKAQRAMPRGKVIG